jgi:NTE family protein
MSDHASSDLSFPEEPTRPEIALTLSGGGVRAVIFHLGVLRRLAASGLLESVVALSTVSGGSLAAAAIFSKSAMKWPSSSEYESRLFPILRQLLTHSDLFSLRALGWKGIWKFNCRIFSDRAGILVERLRSGWGITGDLRDLPDKPSWQLNSTCFETGKNWRFSKRAMGDWQTGRHFNPPFSIAEAAAASAAVPYAIGALRLRLPKLGWQHIDPATREPVSRKEAPFEFVRLWDGGAYENLGLETFYKPGEPLREGNFLICSDASGPLTKPIKNPIKLLLKGQLSSPRLFDVASDQIRALRSRMLVRDLKNNSINGVLLRMGNSVRDIDTKTGKHRESQFYDAFLTDEESSLSLAHPTDLQAPSEAVFDRIARHGFEVTDSTLLAYAPSLIT